MSRATVFFFPVGKQGLALRIVLFHVWCQWYLHELHSLILLIRPAQHHSHDIRPVRIWPVPRMLLGLAHRS